MNGANFSVILKLVWGETSSGREASYPGGTVAISSDTGKRRNTCGMVIQASIVISYALANTLRLLEKRSDEIIVGQSSRKVEKSCW